MLKLTIYVEPHDPHAEKHIANLEAAVEAAKAPSLSATATEFVRDILSNPETLQHVLQTFGIVPRAGAQTAGEQIVASKIAAPWSTEGDGVFVRRFASGGSGAFAAIVSNVPFGAASAVWETDDEQGNSETVAFALRAADASLLAHGCRILGHPPDDAYYQQISGENMTPPPSCPVPSPFVVPSPSPVPVVPAPSVVIEDTEAAMLKHAALLHEGEGAFDALTRAWTQNFGVEQAPQPDRTSALMACFSGHGRAASTYIRERGGLAGACIDSLVRQTLVPADEAVLLGQKVALNMVQVGSALGVPVDALLERSMFARELHPAGPVPGTLHPGEFDRSQLPLPDGSFSTAKV